jgi:hypothetical protein
MMYLIRIAVILVIAVLQLCRAFVSRSIPISNFRQQQRLYQSTEMETNANVAQTVDTSRDKVMTFSYDMSLEPKYEKPTYPGTGNGLSGESGEYDVIVIGSGMGGLSCGAISAKYGDRVLVLESHIKCGGSAHTFSRMHKGEKYSFEVGPSIFEGLDRPSLNPLRMIFDLLDEQMPVKTYTGLGYWTPTGYWRFPIGSQQKFEDLLMQQAEDGPKAIEVCVMSLQTFFVVAEVSYIVFFPLIGMECVTKTSQDTRWINYSSFSFKSKTRCRFLGYNCWYFTFRCHSSGCLFGFTFNV